MSMGTSFGIDLEYGENLGDMRRSSTSLTGTPSMTRSTSSSNLADSGSMCYMPEKRIFNDPGEMRNPSPQDYVRANVGARDSISQMSTCPAMSNPTVQEPDARFHTSAHLAN